MALSTNLKIKDLMTVRQAAAVLGISTQAVHKRIKSGSLRSIPVGDIILVLKHDVHLVDRKKREKAQDE